MLLAQVAQLLVCQKCGLHGKIKFADGALSEVLHSEEEAFACVLKAVQSGSIHPVEAEYLREAIRNSTLPEVKPEFWPNVADDSSRSEGKRHSTLH